MQSAASSEQGLDEFLGHIRNRPASDKLVDRFLDLVAEMSYDRRRIAMNKLLSVLLDANPHRALHSSYVFLQSLRNEGAPTEEEVAALEMTQTCFKKLGKDDDASVVREEINRLRGIRTSTRMAELHQKIQVKIQPQPIPAQRVTAARDSSREAARGPLSIPGKAAAAEVPTSKKALTQTNFDKIGEELFAKLRGELGNFVNIRHQYLAVETLIKAYQKIYQTYATGLRNAIIQFGRNPLLWTHEGKFRPEMTDYFIESRLFSMGRDSLTEIRLKTCLEVLTSWFDQKLHAPTVSWEDMSPAQEISFLETTLLAILDKEM